MTNVTVLDREMYSEAEAARYLRVLQSTLNYWLEGGERRGKVYPPVIRTEPRGRRAPVTWAEFIEAGLLRSYRRSGIPMAELRTFIDLLRERYQIPYPLADRRPYIAGRRRVAVVAGLSPAGLWLRRRLDVLFGRGNQMDRACIPVVGGAGTGLEGTDAREAADGSSRSSQDQPCRRRLAHRPGPRAC